MWTLLSTCNHTHQWCHRAHLYVTAAGEHTRGFVSYISPQFQAQISISKLFHHPQSSEICSKHSIWTFLSGLFDLFVSGRRVVRWERWREKSVWQTRSGKLPGQRLKGILSLFISCQPPSPAMTELWRQASLMEMKWNVRGVFCPALDPSHQRRAGTPEDDSEPRGPGERSEADDWQMSDGVCVLGSLKPSSDENLKSMGCISEGSVWSAVV